MQLERLSNNILQTQMNLSVEQLIQDFNLSRKSSLYTDKTRRYYSQQLSHFQTWLVGKDIIIVDQITPSLIRLFLSEHADRGEKPNTTHARYRAIKTFLRWLENEELLLKNPIAKVGPPKVPKELQPPLKDDELNKIISYLEREKGNLAIRNRALFYLLLDSGIRIEECLKLRIGDINQEGTFVVHGKGQKDRLVRISGTTHGYLSKYLKIRNGQDGSPLWIGVRGEMTINGLMETLEKLGKKVKVHLSAHEIRRTFAVKSLKNGMNLRALQLLLGHADISTTTRYLDLAESDIIDQHKLASPVENLRVCRLTR